MALFVYRHCKCHWPIEGGGPLSLKVQYILFNYSSLSSCADQGLDSVSDSTSSGSRLSSQSKSFEVYFFFPFPFCEFCIFSALIDGPSDCAVEVPKTTFFRRGGGLLKSLENLQQQQAFLYSFWYCAFCFSHIFFQAAVSACLIARLAFFCAASLSIKACSFMNMLLVACCPLPPGNSHPLGVILFYSFWTRPSCKVWFSRVNSASCVSMGQTNCIIVVDKVVNVNQQSGSIVNHSRFSHLCQF